MKEDSVHTEYAVRREKESSAVAITISSSEVSRSPQFDTIKSLHFVLPINSTVISQISHEQLRGVCFLPRC